VVVPLRGIRVFIATPGGLDSERQRFRDVLMNFNEDDGHARGVTFIPVGWELSPAGMGRPQEKINEDVRTSDYLVLVLWDRWGTPPATDGPYTSGTEEEYNVARECVANPAAPMKDTIVMFKGVDPKQLSDPGAQLSRVLDFKNRLEEEKSLLFSTFDSIGEFERYLRKHLMLWTREEDDGQRTAPVKAPPPESPHSETVEPPPLDVQPLLERAEELADAGRLTQAESLYARAVVGRTDLFALTKYVRFLRRTGRLDQAHAVSERLLELGQTLGDREAQVEALSNRAIISRKRGDYGAAMRDLEAAVTITERRGEAGLSDLAFLYDNLGLTSRKAGDFGTSVEMHERALKIRRDLGDPRGIANASNHLGALLRQQGRVTEAERLHREAIDLFVAEGYKRGEAQARANLGEDLQVEDRLDDARAEYQASLDLNRELKSPEGVGMNWWQLGRLALAEGDLDLASRYARQGMTQEDTPSRPEAAAGSLHLFGQVEIARGRYDSAERSLDAALDVYREVDQRLGIAWTALDYAQALALQGKSDDARAMLKEARSAAAGLDHAQLEQALAEAEITVSQSEPKPEQGLAETPQS
jgi:tetratricopeptide (TPR) repeat protein